MAKKARTKATAVRYPVPQSRDEADLYIRQIGELQRERTVLEASLNETLAQTKALFEVRGQELGKEIENRAKGLETWAAANRDDLTRKGQTKTAKLAAGELSWRTRPPKVSLRGVAEIIERIKSLKLDEKFLRTKEEINKEAMLADVETASAIDGVSIGSAGEDFVVKPFQTELEQVA